MAPAETARTIVVLIHGTFAQEAEWVSPQSLFSRALTKRLGGKTDIVPFRWSGRNSHAARAEAANELSELIRSLTLRFPGVGIYLVAHSHGGNVALYAIRDDPKIASAVRAVINMATPYIVPHKRNIERYVRTVLVWLVPPPPLLILVVYVAGFVSLFIPFEFSAIFFGLPIGAVSAIGFFVLVRRLSLNLLLPRLASKQEDIVGRLRHRPPPSVKILNIRISGDEASMWLRLVSALANFPYRVWTPLVMVFFVVGPALIASLYIGWESYFYFRTPSNIMGHHRGETIAGAIEGGATFGVGVFVVLITIVALLTLLWQPLSILWSNLFSAHALGFGGRGIYLNWLVKVGAQPRPENADVTDKIYQRRFKLLHLRHSRLYSDKNIINDIAAWINRLG